MILYFSATGNSKFAADFLSQRLQDECISLHQIIKKSSPLKFFSQKPFIVIAPVYAWRLPQIIERLIEKAEFTGNKQIYFIGTMASETGNCDRYCQKLSVKKKMNFKGFCGVPMPNNYVIDDIMPQKEEIDKILTQAIPMLEELSQKIIAGSCIEKIDHTAHAAVLSGIVNCFFSHFMVSSKNFTVSSSCISCGKCETVCPVNNIQLKDGKPFFGTHCINCYACIHHCPVEAINIKGKTETHGRYLCPDYHSWKASIT